jgi:hypothetical protein
VVRYGQGFAYTVGLYTGVGLHLLEGMLVLTSWTMVMSAAGLVSRANLFAEGTDSLEVRVSYHLSLLHRIASHCSGIPFWFFFPYCRLDTSVCVLEPVSGRRSGFGLGLTKTLDKTRQEVF